MTHPLPAPPRRRFRPLIPIVLCCLAIQAKAGEPIIFSRENVMGTSMELQVWADGHEAARRAESRALSEINRLSAILSEYDPASEFSRWRRATGRPAVVSAPLWDALAAADSWRARSGGAFDPRVAVLTNLWTESAGRGREPSDAEIRRALAAMAAPPWRLAPATREATALVEQPVSLNAIVKGYIIERAVAEALGDGREVRGVVLNVGGDLGAAGRTEGLIGVANPLADSESSPPLTFIEVHDRAVATSGWSQRGFSINGEWRSHIFDPRTGRPVSQVVGATVIAPRGADADALATICNVLAPEEGLALVEATEGAACLIVEADGRIHRSAGWDQYERPGALPLASSASPRGLEPAVAAEEPSWGDEFELVVDFEINAPEGEGVQYRRPYVAIWAEDQAGNPVRNILLWVSQGGAGPFQWLSDLKRWKRADSIRKKTDKREMVFVMSRPTRSPGKYKAVWDGKDDHGKPVPPGEYTLYIEAAREHGTYQSMRAKLTIADQPFSEDLKGNVEIKSATVSYRHKGGDD